MQIKEAVLDSKQSRRPSLIIREINVKRRYRKRPGRMQNKLGSMIKRRDLSGISLIASDNTVRSITQHTTMTAGIKLRSKKII